MDKTPGELYQERLKRIEDAVQLKVPDRVPVFIEFGYLPATYTGMTFEDTYYEREKFAEAHKKIVLDMEPDLFQCALMPSGKANEAVGVQIVKWPGHGIPSNRSHQFVEGEYMKADEYDELIESLADFIVGTYLPRVCGALGPFQVIPHLSDLACVALGMMDPISRFASPEFASACVSFYTAVQEVKAWFDTRMRCVKEMQELGFPSVHMLGPVSPFDYISDNLRGMRGIMLDMYRQPDKLLKAIEVLLPIVTKKASMTKKTMAEYGTKIVFIATHRGADGFMSLKQFEKFYWPNLKAVILSYVDEGFTPNIFWEGDYTTRLEYLLELPKGKVLNRFDSTDLVRAKEVLGGHQCICGGMMPSMLQTGTVSDVREHCQKLIDVIGKDGGYIMGTSCAVDEAKPANLKAMIDGTREYGVYN